MTRIQLTWTVNVFYMMPCAGATDIAEVQSTRENAITRHSARIEGPCRTGSEASASN